MLYTNADLHPNSSSWVPLSYSQVTQSLGDTQTYTAELTVCEVRRLFFQGPAPPPSDALAAGIMGSEELTALESATWLWGEVTV